MSKEFFVNSVKKFIDRKNLASEFIKKYSCNNQKNIFLYGAGHAVEYYYKYLTNREIEVKGFVDKNIKGKLYDLPIYTLEEVKKKFNSEKIVFVISSPSFVKEIKEELLSYVKEEQIYSFDVELYQYYGGSYEIYKKNIKY